MCYALSCTDVPKRTRGIPRPNARKHIPTTHAYAVLKGVVLRDHCALSGTDEAYAAPRYKDLKKRLKADLMCMASRTKEVPSYTLPTRCPVLTKPM